MHKKILFVLLLLGMNTPLRTSYIIEKSGFYGVYVTSMPFWTFWNYNKALRLLAENSHKTVNDVATQIELKIPVFSTWDYEQAVALKKKLAAVNCDLAIREMQFVCDSKEEAEQVQAQLSVTKAATS